MNITRREFLWLSIGVGACTLATPLLVSASTVKKTVETVSWILGSNDDPNRVFIRESNIKLSKSLDKIIPSWFRIWVITDLHINKLNSLSIEQLDKLILWSNIDLLIIAWDILAEQTTSINDYYSLLDNILSKMQWKVFATLWNHDYIIEWDKVAYNKELLDYFKFKWIEILDNSTKELLVNWAKINLIWKWSNLRWNFDDQTYLPDNKWINILVTHEPIWFEKVKGRFDLWIAGHTHWCSELLISCAMARSFLMSGKLGFNSSDFKFNNWLYSLPDKYLLTSSGIGRHWQEKYFSPRFLDVVTVV